MANIPEILKNRTFAIGVMGDKVLYVTERKEAGLIGRTDNTEIRIALMNYEVDAIEMTKDFVDCSTYVWNYIFTEDSWTCVLNEVMRFSENNQFCTVFDTFRTRLGFFKKYYRGNNGLLEKAFEFSKYSCDGMATIDYEKKILYRKEATSNSRDITLSWYGIKENGTLNDVFHQRVMTNDEFNKCFGTR